MVRLLDEVGRGLQRRRGYDETVRTAVESVVPELADLAIAMVQRNADQRYWEVAHVDPARAGPVRDIVAGAEGAMRRAAAGRADRHWWWIPSVADPSFHRLIRGDRAVAELVEALEVRSLIVVPLRAGGRLHGALGLARVRPDQPPFNGAELAAAQIIGRRAAAAIESAEIAEGVRTEVAKRAGLDHALRKWTQVFHVAGWGAVIVDGDDCRIDIANPAFAQMHGYPDAEAVTGRRFADLLPPDRVGDLDGWSAEAEPASYESMHRRVDGSTFPTLVNATHLGPGGTHAYVVTVQDLTEVKRTEERLRRAQRMEAVGRLAGGVAHEVNNMMTIILGFADILAGQDTMAGGRRDIEEIRKAATRAGNITRQLLAFSRQEDVNPAPLRLNDVVSEMVPVLRLMLPANIRLEATLTPHRGSVKVDRTQLEQVLINLAFNARDAMPNGGTIRLMTEFRHLDEAAGRSLIGIPIAPDEYGLLSVIDTGHGMDTATLSQIFEPFFTTKPTGHGTGLGLATVYGIVKQSGGYIWAESTVGEGTTVTVCLPQIHTPAAREVVGAPASPRGRASGTILVVEDEEGVRELASRILRLEGYRVLTPTTGVAAVGVLSDSDESVDLVLTDVVIPDVELAKLERAAREQRPDRPILYMSGYPHDDIVQRGLLRREAPFLQKPFTSAELAQRVRDVLGAPVDSGGRALDEELDSA